MLILQVCTALVIQPQAILHWGGKGVTTLVLIAEYNATDTLEFKAATEG